MNATNMQNTTDLFKNFSETFTKGMTASTKFYEDGMKFWTDAMTRTTDEFRNRVEKMADELNPVTKRSAERVQRLFDENTQRGIALVKQGMEMSPMVKPVGTPAEFFDRNVTFSKTAFETMRESMDATLKVGAEAMREMTSCCGMNSCSTDAAAKRPTK